MDKFYLKPCPFCGADAYLKIKRHIPKGFEFTPTCPNTSCPGHITKIWLDEEKAVEMWNRRVFHDTNS